MTQEKWKDIPTWEGIYQVSNYGRIKRHFKNGKDSFLTPFATKNGYYNIKLTYKGRQETWKVHRLVMTVFERPLLDTEDVHHKNELKWCNAFFNLQIKNHKDHVKEHWDDLKLQNRSKNMKKKELV